jgi:hypothetical protein
MATIFGNSLATGAYAKGAYDPLATVVTETENAPKDTEDGAATAEQVGADDATTGNRMVQNHQRQRNLKWPILKTQPWQWWLC